MKQSKQIPKKGCLLCNLEAEVKLNPEVFRQSLLFHGAFSRRIALSDSHALDNSLVIDFIRKNWKTLQEEEFPENGSPLLASCGKEGAALWKAIDLYLVPKGPNCRPTYLTHLSPKQNDELVFQYDRLRSRDQRRERLIRVAGKEYGSHVDRLSKYFKKHNDGVLQPTSTQNFFDYATTAFENLDVDALRRVERDIVQELKFAMKKWNPRKDGYPSRERLHEAIYLGKPVPRVWQGTVLQPNYEVFDLRTRKAWRYFVNSLHNLYHAQIHRVDAVTSPELNIPRSVVRQVYDRVSQTCPK